MMSIALPVRLLTAAVRHVPVCLAGLVLAGATCASAQPAPSQPGVSAASDKPVLRAVHAPGGIKVDGRLDRSPEGVVQSPAKPGGTIGKLSTWAGADSW